MNESKTPEVDALAFDIDAWNEVNPSPDGLYVRAENARPIELSRNAWRECAQRLAAEADCNCLPPDHQCTRCQALQQFTELSKQ